MRILEVWRVRRGRNPPSVPPLEKGGRSMFDRGEFGCMGLSFGRFLKMGLYFLKNGIQVGKNVVGWDPQDGEPEFAEVVVPDAVIGVGFFIVVTAAVYFDHKFCRLAVKIDDVLADVFLPIKLIAV
jgi:hypothetical protein